MDSSQAIVRTTQDAGPGSCSCCLIGCAHDALAARVEIPLRVSLDTLGEALGAQLVPYRDGRCRYLELQAPKLESVQGGLAPYSSRHRRARGRDRGQVPGHNLERNDPSRAGAVHRGRRTPADAGCRFAARRCERRARSARGTRPSGMFTRGLSASPTTSALRAALAELLRSAAPRRTRRPWTRRYARWRSSRRARARPGRRADRAGDPGRLARRGARRRPRPRRSPRPSSKRWNKRSSHGTPSSSTSYGRSRSTAKTTPCASGFSRSCSTAATQLAAILAGDSARPGNPVRGSSSMHGTSCAPSWSTGATKRYALFFDAADALAALEAAAPGLPLSPEGLRRLARNLKPDDTGNPARVRLGAGPPARPLVRRRRHSRRRSGAAPPRPLAVGSTSSSHGRMPTRRSTAGCRRTTSSRPTRHASGASCRKLLAPSSSARSFPHLTMPVYRSPGADNRAHRKLLAPVCGARRQGDLPALALGKRGHHADQPAGWRGFYDIERVRWDTAYNVRAGTQILSRYLKDYAIPYAERTGDPDHAPRAAYAVYNAGPKAVGRFAKSPPHPREGAWTRSSGRCTRRSPGGASRSRDLRCEAGARRHALAPHRSRGSS